jgi:hypothetical protein
MFPTMRKAMANTPISMANDTRKLVTVAATRIWRGNHTS